MNAMNVFIFVCIELAYMICGGLVLVALAYVFDDENDDDGKFVFYWLLWPLLLISLFITWLWLTSERIVMCILNKIKNFRNKKNK